jgi:IS30 family transposase
MPPTHLAPSASVPTGRFLSFSEHEEIAIELARGAAIRAIARKLGRSPSTISREVRRNAATRGGNLEYRAIAAQWHADRAARRPRQSKLASNPALRAYVEQRLSGQVTSSDGIGFAGPEVIWKKRRAVFRQSRRWSTAWSPEQIAHRLGIDYPEDPTMRISHEAIYQSLYIQGRGALRRELTACLRSGRALRVPRERARSRGKSFVGDAIMISERPPEVEDRAISSWAWTVRQSALSSNAARASRCYCTCPVRRGISAVRASRMDRHSPVMAPKPSAQPSSNP